MKKQSIFFFLLCITLHGFSQGELSSRTGFYTEELSPMPEPVSNNAAIGTEVDGYIFYYSFGGIDSTKTYSGIHNKCWKYNDYEDVWTALPPMPDSLGRIAAGVSVIDTIAYVIGGYHVFEDGQELSFDDVFRFDLKNDVWLENGTPIPVKIDDHVQVVYKDSLIYVVTGWSGSGFSGTNVANVQIYNPANDTWSVGTPVPNTNQYKAFGASGIIVEDTIYYFGGAKISGFNFLPANELRKGSINLEDPSIIDWSVMTTDHTAYRSLAWPLNEFTPGAPEDFIHWIGGSANTYNYDGIAYDGSGGVPARDSSLIYGRFQNAFEAFIGCGGWPEGIIDRMDLRTFIGYSNREYIIIAGGMEADQQVTGKTTKIFQTFCSSIDDTPSNLSLRVYPSPSAGNVYWVNTFQTPVTWVIYNMLGTPVLRMQTEGSGTQSAHMNNKAPGLYTLCGYDNSGLQIISTTFVIN